ncbi:4'-phosphopantetheinyl transferase family protein [Nonomuraea harbinensis]|uniref:4'-phosphopantetheinyl transferase family protein n=1 Tax=Nonomuraea harbinensis TaxID=1286938 RepID=A0ABW1BN02_9ACTN|nr:4'-phosphopantetheinyl transferase superfamily protein [Nonomuraea harbinensis]
MGARVWRVNVDRPERPGWWHCLSAAEREKAAALAEPLARRRYVAAHAALRAVLGELCGVPAAQLAFGTDASGRPCLRSSGGGPDFNLEGWGEGSDFNLSHSGGVPDFNLSHSGEWALIAVAAPGGRVGVDVERVRDDFDHLEMARRMYQAEEAARVCAAGPGAGLAEYFRLWTAKEAYVKASGAGLAGLRDVLVRPEAGTCAESRGGSALSRSLPGSQVPVRWLDVAPGYAAALVTTASTPAPRTG